MYLQVMVDSLLSCGKNANCEDDADVFLSTFSDSDVNHSVLPGDTCTPYRPEGIDHILSICSLSQEASTLCVQERDVVAYIGGHIVRKLCSVVCSGCASYLCDQSSVNENDVDFVHSQKEN